MPDAALPEPTHPYPQRFRWLRFAARITLYTLVLLLLLRLAWGWHIARQFRAQVDSYRALGQPTTLSDFLPPPPTELAPGTETAGASHPLDAAARATLRTGRFDDMNADHDVPLPAKQLPLVRAHLEQNAAALALVREARRGPVTPWAGDGPERDIFDRPYRERLSNLLFLAAVHARTTADHLATVEYALDLLYVADSIHAHPQFTASYRAAVIVDQTCTLLHGLARVLPTSPPASPAATRPATRPAARPEYFARIPELIDALLEEEQRTRRSERAILARRAEFIPDPADAAADSTYSSLDGYFKLPDVTRPFLKMLVRPALVRNDMAAMRRCDQMAAAIREPDWSRARTMAKREPRRRTGLPYVDRLTRPPDDAWSRMFIEQQREAAATRRAAALRLAIRAYQFDHNGSLPPALTDLIPRYLPRVLADPWADGTRPFGYRRDAPRPFIYSIGKDGVDDLAGVLQIPPQWTRGGFADVVHFLARPPTTTRDALYFFQ